MTGVQAIDDLLTAQSQVLPPSTVDVLGRQIVARLDPDRAERFDADAYRRRTYTWSRDFAGMGVYKFVVDPATDALLQAAIDAWSAPRPTGTALDEHGRIVRVPDERTPRPTPRRRRRRPHPSRRRHPPHTHRPARPTPPTMAAPPTMATMARTSLGSRSMTTPPLRRWPTI